MFPLYRYTGDVLCSVCADIQGLPCVLSVQIYRGCLVFRLCRYAGLFCISSLQIYRGCIVFSVYRYKGAVFCSSCADIQGLCWVPSGVGLS